MHFLTTIGITLAAIGGILIYVLKQPLKTSDRLLMAILATFVVKFSLDETSLITGNPLFTTIAGVFGISTIVTCGWYIKYLTDTGGLFGTKQLAAYIPLLAVLICYLVVFYVLRVSLSAPVYRIVVVLMVALIVKGNFTGSVIIL